MRRAWPAGPTKWSSGPFRATNARSLGDGPVLQKELDRQVKPAHGAKSLLRLRLLYRHGAEQDGGKPALVHGFGLGGALIMLALAGSASAIWSFVARKLFHIAQPLKVCGKMGGSSLKCLHDFLPFLHRPIDILTSHEILIGNKGESKSRCHVGFEHGQRVNDLYSNIWWQKSCGLKRWIDFEWASAQHRPEARCIIVTQIAWTGRGANLFKTRRFPNSNHPADVQRGPRNKGPKEEGFFHMHPLQSPLLGARRQPVSKKRISQNGCSSNNRGCKCTKEGSARRIHRAQAERQHPKPRQSKSHDGSDLPAFDHGERVSESGVGFIL